MSGFDVQNVTSWGLILLKYRINSQQPIQSNTLDGVELFDGDLISGLLMMVNQNQLFLFNFCTSVIYAEF